MSLNAASPVIHQVEKLVAEHRGLVDEPLLLAICFVPARDPGDTFLFEVVEGFGAGAIDEDRKLFEVTYASTPSFPLAPGQRLHLILTSPEELDVACQEQWPSIEEIRDAMRSGQFITLYSDPSRPDLEGKLHG